MNIKPPLMQGSFEKDVQQKMEELRLTPSAPVWQKIENEIRPESKKRRGLLWISFLGLLSLAGSWWVYTHLGGDDPSSAASKPSNSVTSSNKSATKGEKNHAVIQKNQNIISPSSSETNHSEGKNSLELDLQNETPVSGVEKPKKKNLTNIPGLKTSTFHLKQRAEQQPGYPNVDDKKMRKLEKDVATDFKAQIPVIDSIAGSPAQDSIRQLEKNKTENLPALSLDTTALKKKVATVKKWQPRLVFSAGWSQATGHRSGSLLYNSAPLSSAVPRYGLAAPTTGGPAFSLGILWLKQLNERWQFSVGVQYAHYAIRSTVGDKKMVDTSINFRNDRIAVDEFYTNTTRSNYTNRLGVIELPVRLSYKVLKTVPLRLSAGVSYGRVISTNALSFSSSSNVYYQNKNNEVRHQLPLHTSLQYSFERKKIKLSAGPYFQYNLLKRQKEYTGEASHLVFAGLRTELGF